MQCREKDDRPESNIVPDLSDELAICVSQVVNNAIKDGNIVGANIIVAQHGNVILRYASGYADRETGRVVTEKTMFRLASMTKPIVSAAALALVEQGILHLDKPIVKWLPYFTPRLNDGEAPVITLRHLLTHTSGLSYGFLSNDNEPYRKYGVSDGIDETVLSLEDNLRRLVSVPLQFKPGTSWCYSLATDVVGAIMESACGKPLPEIVEQYVTGPLGMADTKFFVKDTSRLAKAYADDGEGRVPRPMGIADTVMLPGCGPIRYAPGRITNPQAYPSGGAGMVGTAEDYIKFLEAIRKGGAPILSKESVRLLTEDMVQGFDVAAAGPGFGFGMGFAVVRNSVQANTPRYPGSFEWGGVYGTKMFVDPEAGLSVVMLTNTALHGLIGPFPANITRAVYDTLGLENRLSPANTVKTTNLLTFTQTSLGLFHNNDGVESSKTALTSLALVKRECTEGNATKATTGSHESGDAEDYEHCNRRNYCS
jgi:CubicO group peptidase (beta-lactamase class C family)